MTQKTRVSSNAVGGASDFKIEAASTAVFRIGGIYRRVKSEVLKDVSHSVCCFVHMVLFGLNPGPRVIVA
jgi:hypothetical protein